MTANQGPIPRAHGRNSFVLCTGKSFNLPALVFGGLLVCSVSLALLIGDIGFQGDDWWQFSWPYWYSFPESLRQYVIESRRPVEGFYTVLAFELFRFDRFCYTVSALLLSAGGCLLMGQCVRRCFPGRDSFFVLTVFFAFLYPALSNLIFLFHTDNSRISVLLFWLSVYLFQRWATRSGSWSGITVPVAAYVLATLTYENTCLLIWIVPGFIWPLRERLANGLSVKALFGRLFVAITAGFGTFLFIRFLVFSGGAVKGGSVMPGLEQISTYIHNLVRYTLIPFTELPADSLAWVWAGLVATVVAALLFASTKKDPDLDTPEHPPDQGAVYIAALAIGIVALGMAPYLLAGYNSGTGLTGQSRIYSSAGFGAALLLGLVATAWKRRIVLAVSKTLAVMALVFMAAFLAHLRVDWQNAAEKRDAICASLLEQVPDVAPGSSFLFLDLQSYLAANGIHQAAIFQGVDGLPEFIRMLYGRRDIFAYFLYPDSPEYRDGKPREARASSNGLTVRGSAVRPPIPLDSLLIYKREGTKLLPVDKITADSHRALIKWDGVSSIASNPSLVRPRSDPDTELMKLTRQKARLTRGAATTPPATSSERH
jgi:hypothetical protein